jgi:hypothetical protein
MNKPELLFDSPEPFTPDEPEPPRICRKEAIAAQRERLKALQREGYMVRVGKSGT